MRVAIDLTKTNFDNPVGVDRYAMAMTKALKEGHPEVDWVVLTKKDIWPSFFSTQLGVALATWKDRKIDVLWSPVPTMPILRRFGLKTVVTIHDLEGSKWSTKWSLRLADAVVAVSENTALQLINVGAGSPSPSSLAVNGRGNLAPTDKITIIREGVDTTTFYPRSAEEIAVVKSKLGITGEYFLFVGTVGPRKNVEGLIRGFAEFVTVVIPGDLCHPVLDTGSTRILDPGFRRDDSTCLVIAGSVPDEYRQILDLPAELGIEGRVKFLGRVDDNDLPALYSGAEATCLVSHDEGFGLPILESLACGRPVVVSNRGIMPELAGSCGVTIDPTSVASISDGLRQVSEIDICKCHIQAEKYSWKTAADALMAVLDVVGADRRVRPLTAVVMDVNVNKISFDETLRQISSFVSEPRFHLVTTVNPEFILTAGKDNEFKDILNKADLSLPDGLGVVLAAGARHRVAGADLVPALVKLASEKGWTIGLLGGEDWHGQDVCELVKQHFLSKYPSLIVNYCSREAAPELFSKPIDILFVAFGAPKQEKWLWSNKADLQVNVGIGVGGTFDFIVGKQWRAPLLCQKLGLEGLWRLFLEPKRWRRVFRAYVVFPIKFCLSLLPLSSQ